MNYREVKQMVASFGFPFTYYSFPEKEAPALPYVLFYYPTMTPETAGDTHHAQIYSLNVELYTRNKDFSVESAVENVLLEAGMVFTKEETYLNDEHMFEVLYLMEVIIDG